MSADGDPTVLRVVQWTTGNVARQSLRRVVERPDMELVGVYAHSADKVGRDAGELAGLGRELGIAATDQIEAIIALRPDCVAYMPLFPDVDEMAQLLRAGINIVTTSEFLTGRSHGPAARPTLEEAARAGGASVFGSGVNPGWAEYMAAAASGPVRHIDSVRIFESFNLALIASEANQDDFGWGRPAGDPGHAESIEQAVYEFEDAVDLLAALLDVRVDEVRCQVRFAHATKDLDVPGREIRAGTVAGIEVSWFGTVDGRDVIELATQWTMTADLDLDWTVLNGYLIEVRGDPGIKVTLEFVPSVSLTTLEELMAMGHVVTAMPAVNAIAAVVAAPPGIVTYADLRPMTAPVGAPQPHQEERP